MPSGFCLFFAFGFVVEFTDFWVLGDFAMTRLLLFGVVMMVSGCTRKTDPQVHEIGLDSLTRSYQVAGSFTGKLVKLTIPPESYSVVNRELHVSGTVPRTPPLVVFKLSPLASLPDPKKTVVVIGKCGEPQRDGVWRSFRADYSVTVADCLVAQP